ncbi:probable peptidoglycan muropeptide transporter SLC46 [Ornithodoros turicata]|uniref:probable peptidoglycan muropeptide transporter SLC46 n=1 Tax=Ornithodoros turicata TaxID=34597 RepID=UPI00313A0B75
MTGSPECTVDKCVCQQGPPLLSVHWSDVWAALVRSQALCAFLLVYTMSYAMRLFITQDLLLTKTCLYHFRLDPFLCANVSNWTETKDSIERVANNYSLFMLLVQLTPAAVLSIFLGPWCDKYGHKIPIFMATMGGVFQDLGTIYTVVDMGAPLYANVLCSLPNGFSGGLVCVLTAVCSNASLSSQGPLRTLQFLIVLMSAMIGMACGQLAAGHVFRSGGYLPVFAMSAGMLLACLLWVALVIKNPPTAHKADCKTMCKDLLQVRNFVNGILVVGRTRTHKGRAQILLLMSSMCTILFVSEGTRGINFFYAKKMYDWDVSKYSDINAGFLFLRMVSVSVFVILANVLLRLSDCTIALIGICCGIMQSVSTALARNEILFYVSYLLGTLDASAPIGIKSHASKLLDRDETTQVFSVWIAVEALTPIVGYVFGSQVYNASINFYPGMPYVIYVIFELYPLGSVLYCWFAYRDKACSCPCASCLQAYATGGVCLAPGSSHQGAKPAALFDESWPQNLDSGASTSADIALKNCSPVEPHTARHKNSKYVTTPNYALEH